MSARLEAFANISSMTLGEIVTRKRKEIRELARFHGATNVRSFGSVARNEAKAADVDFLVEMEPGRSLLDLVGLWQDMEDLLGCKVDVISERARRFAPLSGSDPGKLLILNDLPAKNGPAMDLSSDF